jgi:hypothetical protein
MQFGGSIQNYFSNFWNWIEFLGLLLFYVGLILRFIPNNNETFLAARYFHIKEKKIKKIKSYLINLRCILCVDVIFWFLKLLSFYTPIKELGPKILMIKKLV